MTVGYDLTHQLNDFDQPKLTSEIELIRNTLMYILFSEPGQYPSLPMVGLNIENYLYMDYDEINTDNIKDDIISQCEALGAYIDSESIEVVKRFERNRPVLYFRVSGKESYPPGYIANTNPNTNYVIGVTYDEYKNLMLAMND